jgi:uncharacterized membrane protein YfcA
MLFQIILGIVAVAAGSIASVAGFGIGSLLTPVMASREGIGVAVVAVSIAHFFGTFLRFMMLRKSLDRQVLLTFGLASAAGGIAGAFLHNVFQNIVLTVVFGCLLLLAGISGLTGLSEKVKFRGIVAWLLGGLSGMFGGLVGNQGSIRSGALLGFGLDRDRFVATATGIALMVDVARLPVYLGTGWDQVQTVWQYVLTMTAGVLLGTVAGKKLLEKIPEGVFKKAVSAIVLLIGIFILAQLPLQN